jgi:hypothetical protein
MAMCNCFDIILPTLPLPFRLIKIGLPLIVDDYLYLLPAMTYSVILALSVALYVLRYILQWFLFRRRGGNAPARPTFTLRDLPRISVVALLIAIERILYRYGSGFALGIELTAIKVDNAGTG